jgi:hypothetical protein
VLLLLLLLPLLVLFCFFYRSQLFNQRSSYSSELVERKKNKKLERKINFYLFEYKKNHNNKTAYGVRAYISSACFLIAEAASRTCERANADRFP